MAQPEGLAREAWFINNPALGAYLLWIFSLEHFNKNKSDIHPARFFCVLPLLFHLDTREKINTTHKSRNNLSGFINKFESTNECASDIPLTLHMRIDSLKERSLESLVVALDCGLIIINPETGNFKPNLKLTPKPENQLSNDERELVSSSEKIGYWFASLTLDEISKITKVYF